MTLWVSPESWPQRTSRQCWRFPSGGLCSSAAVSPTQRPKSKPELVYIAYTWCPTLQTHIGEQGWISLLHLPKISTDKIYTVYTKFNTNYIKKKRNKMRRLQDASRKLPAKLPEKLCSSAPRAKAALNTKDGHTKCWFNLVNSQKLIDQENLFMTLFLTASSIYSIFTQVLKLWTVL